MDLNPKYVDSMNAALGHANRATKRLSKMNVRGRLGTIAGVGATMGLGKTLTDDIDDDITTAIPNVLAGSALAVGGAYATKTAAQFIQGGDDSIFTSDIERPDRATSVASDIAERSKERDVNAAKDTSANISDESKGTRKHDAERSELLKEHRKTDSQQASIDTAKGKQKATVGSMPNELSQAEIDRKLKSYRRVNKGLRGAGALGMMAFGAATVLDIQQKVDEGRRVDDMTDEQEKNLRQKEKRENEYKRAEGYRNINLGDMVFQLFDERIGHHKMGNSKFQ